MSRVVKVGSAVGVAIAVGFLCYWFSCGMSGDVFPVSSEGSALPAPGAHVYIFRSTPQRDVTGFHAKYDLVEHAGVNYLASQELSGKVRPDIARDMAPTVLAADCTGMGVIASGYFRPPVETLYADKGGKFAVRLRPGNYILLVDGQAGTEGAEWIQSVSFDWRANVHLVQPLCRYALP